MASRFATAAVAIALSLTAPAAFAQAGNWLHAERAPVGAYDDITTGSIGIARPQARGGWEAVSSAKAGNANQQNFPVQQYGQTAGDPAY